MASTYEQAQLTKIIAEMEPYFTALLNDTAQEFLTKNLEKQTTAHEDRQMDWVEQFEKIMERRLRAIKDHIVNKSVIQCPFFAP